VRTLLPGVPVIFHGYTFYSKSSRKNGAIPAPAAGYGAKYIDERCFLKKRGEYLDHVAPIPLSCTGLFAMGYAAALLIGILLGLIGGGGSILTVPALVYLFGYSPLLATTDSLFIVGTTSRAGAIASMRRKAVDLRTVAAFGIPSVITVFLIRRLVIPRIPQLIRLGPEAVSFATLTMLTFGVLMLLASFSMIRTQKKAGLQPVLPAPTVLPLYGILIGLITGFLGAGGGFLLIPVMVLLLRLPMKTAIGTSLSIIALNSMVGFFSDGSKGITDWPFLLTVTGIAIGGVILGNLLNRRIPGARLKAGFGWFVLVMGVFVITRELMLLR